MDKKEIIGNDQEMVQSERNSHSEGWEKTKMTLNYMS